MILVFGGTTEGRRAVEVLEEGGSRETDGLGEEQPTYFYSTKTGEQELTLQHGRRIDGALDRERMTAFCQEHDIRLIVDAAHPFAAQLHQTIAQVAERLSISAIRYERIYPPRDPDITWIDDYSDLNDILPSLSREGQGVGILLATTGVQSIAKLKPLEAEGIKVYYRILPRESSMRLAKAQGANEEQLCYYDDPKDIPVEADAILLKESGLTGGFQEKVAAAKARGMRVFALKRPEMPAMFTKVNGPYGLRRAVEKLLPAFFPLKSGLTTGTCATAAAIAATMLFVRGEGRGERRVERGERMDLPTEVLVILPNGETISVPVGYGDGYAYCIKEAGDDPDVTDGIEVRAESRSLSLNRGEWLVIEGGEGVGRFTLPGFDYPPGEPAINKGPREMIRKNLERLITPLSLREGLGVRLSVVNGEEIARRTFNPRLGIEGGISIIGVSGIVKPFSEEAFIDSIRKCMEVAKASGADRVVINSGGKSERFVKSLYPDLPRQAFVEYGNYIGETLKMANELGFRNVTLGVMLGKAVKLAAGHLDTHSRKTVMDKAFIQQMLHESDISIDISDMTLARELWERIPEDGRMTFARTVIQHCHEHCAPLLPNGELLVLLIDDNGKIFGV